MASFKRLVTVNTIVEEDSIFGQQAVLDAIVVGAVIVNSPRDVRDYSSQGPSTIYTNFSTQASVQRDSLDAVGTDGVQTAIGQPPHWRAIFNGTSAAAPHVAAVAALLLDGKPQLSPTECGGPQKLGA